MADISKIKLPDGVTHNIKDSSIEIGGRNLLVGSYKYTKDSPFINTTTAKDGYKYLSDVHTVVQVHTGETYIMQAKTDGDWSTRHGEQPTNFVTLWLVGSANVSPLTTDLHQILITSQNTNPNYLGNGKWLWTIPSNWDGKYIYIRVNNYNTDGTTSVTHNYWDFKLEKGSKATDWSIAPEDQIAGSGTSGCIAKFDGTNTVTNGPALGSSTTTYLRNDGQWATPTDNKVKQSILSEQAYGSYPILLSDTSGQHPSETTSSALKTGHFYFSKMYESTSDESRYELRLEDDLFDNYIIMSPFEGISASGSIWSDGSIVALGNLRGNQVICNSISTNSVTLPHTYSATEQIVGYWIDGKPIYEQTITLSNITLSQNAEYQHSVLLIGIDQPIKIEAVISLSNGTDKRTIPVGLQTNYYITVNFTRDVIAFRRGSGNVTGATIYATIQYTKT